MGMILFVDDEKRRMQSYIDELERSHYKVEMKSDVDSALNFFDEHHDKIKLLILDVMMPPGNSFEKVDTGYGLRTGIHFYKKIREKNVNLQIIIFTNVSRKKIEEYIDSNEKSLFLQKEDYLPFELVDKINFFLNDDDSK